jgi:hypothetical protein
MDMRQSREMRTALRKAAAAGVRAGAAALIALTLVLSGVSVAGQNASQQHTDHGQAQTAPAADAAATTGTSVFRPQGDTYRSPEEPVVPRLSPPGGTHFRTNDEPERLEDDPHDRPMTTATWAAVGIVSAALLLATGLAFVSGSEDWDSEDDDM